MKDILLSVALIFKRVPFLECLLALVGIHKSIFFKCAKIIIHDYIYIFGGGGGGGVRSYRIPGDHTSHPNPT